MFNERRRDTRGRRIKIGDTLRYIGPGIDSVKYGKVTPGNIYKSIGRYGPNILITNDSGAQISFNWAAFDFAE